MPGRGLPEQCDLVADRLHEKYGRHVRLSVATEAFGGDNFIDVAVDGERVGSFTFGWDPTLPLNAVLNDLEDRIEELCAEELGSGSG